MKDLQHESTVQSDSMFGTDTHGQEECQIQGLELIVALLYLSTFSF